MIDWTASAVQIERMTRAYDPWPVARTRLGGEEMLIWRAAVETAPTVLPARSSASSRIRWSNAERATQIDRSSSAGAKANAGGGFFARQTYRGGRAIRLMSEHVVRAGDQGLASRLAAVDILFRVDQESGYADVLLGGRLPDFAPADRRLITRLVLGTIAWQGRLDYELEHLTGRKLAGIQPVALAILRMGLFQLRFLDRIPQHAVVDTAVSIAKRIPRRARHRDLSTR